MAALLMVACQSPLIDDEQADDNQPSAEVVKTKKFTFTLKGDFGAPTFTRGYLQADGQSMTDLWVFDYVGDECVQSVHQTPDDADWGAPQLMLAYGAHHVYFVASRGDGAALDEEAHTITWNTPRDTFWKDYTVEVVSTSNGNRAVTLDRVATKLRLTVNDEVPAVCAAVNVTPEHWYYGWDYMEGTPAASKAITRTVSVPSSYVGTSGQLVVNIFGLSGADEWTTDISVTATSSSDAVIGEAVLTDAPFAANRASEYSGNLFSNACAMDVSLNAEWAEPVVATW